jgi:hypothetical protein
MDFLVFFSPLVTGRNVQKRDTKNKGGMKGNLKNKASSTLQVDRRKHLVTAFVLGLRQMHVTREGPAKTNRRTPPYIC